MVNGNVSGGDVEAIAKRKTNRFKYHSHAISKTHQAGRDRPTTIHYIVAMCLYCTYMVHVFVQTVAAVKNRQCYRFHLVICLEFSAILCYQFQFHKSYTPTIRKFYNPHLCRLDARGNRIAPPASIDLIAVADEMWQVMRR